MKPDMFEEPVTILLDLGIPTEVKSVMQGYRILMDWRNPADQSRELCKAAINGEIDAQTARAVFVAFAERHDLLAPEIGSLVAHSSKRNSAPHIR